MHISFHWLNKCQRLSVMNVATIFFIMVHNLCLSLVDIYICMVACIMHDRILDTLVASVMLYIYIITDSYKYMHEHY